ncbi:MAG: DMT family transporter [Acidobacteria bacterium]|nr:DMT family transporter [Acidobacteriota bacterium]
MKPFLLTAFALSAFAFNSILCRMALGKEEIDPAGFTAVRVLAGAVTLTFLSLFFKPRYVESVGLGVKPSRTRGLLHSGNWTSAFFLFAYALCFSFAYLGLTTATGALILFGAVQMTMIAASIIKGERPGMWELMGIAVAFGGLVYLVLPGLTSPPLVSSLLMALAGAAWGFYTLRGRTSVDPLADTTGNFIRAVPMAAVSVIPFIGGLHLSVRGVVLAVLSGALASGVGYSVWYAALKYHTATRAAVLQLAVPAIAAAGGVLLLSESAETRLLVASFLILGGILLAIFGKNASRMRKPAR